MPYSQYARNKLNDHVHGKAAYTSPVVYVGLSTSTPTNTDTNVTEPATGAYARVTTSAATWGTSSAGSITNTAAITFPTSTASWGTVTHVVAYDAPTGGNLLWYASITSQSVPSGVTPTIAPGAATSNLT